MMAKRPLVVTVSGVLPLGTVSTVSTGRKSMFRKGKGTNDNR